LKSDTPKSLTAITIGESSVVWKLDRLTRSLSDLLRILAKVDESGAGFKSLTESIDTTQPAGRLMMNMLGSFNQFEREIGGGRYKLSASQQGRGNQND
jgi:DNA invertase Pin-like site-specific DNA recombinase